MRKTRSCRSRGMRGGVVAPHRFLGGLSPVILRHHSGWNRTGSAERIVARASFRRNGLRTLQELHRSNRCRNCDYPANTDHNMTPGARLRTKTVLLWRKLNQLFLSNQYPNGGSLESILFAKLVFEKAEVGGSDIVRVADKQCEDRWLCRDLGHEGRLGDLRRLAFPHW